MAPDAARQADASAGQLAAMPTDVVEFKKEKCSIFNHPDPCPTSEFTVMIANE
jgi:hypothetical protein